MELGERLRRRRWMFPEGALEALTNISQLLRLRQTATCVFQREFVREQECF